ncbi:MAG: hypothetical protein CL920_20255 [Deltaproteobacteria bacterium]|nr:hypothetical protein [Deltaproteobacteria bacterium]MBU51025.1 hypothetical protein [Deltaproteobacteria bacterium]|tara:strand:- start:1628 stop:2047 length:420 start_codon:yes stop_codon:yes gene_type:complete
MKYVATFLMGLLFAVGLTISGMTLPSKVIGFLDFTGKWDPALIFVMVGGILTYGIGLPLITKRSGPIFDKKFSIPTRKDLTPNLVIGAGLFGIGWGLGGFCPGPGLTSLTTLAGPVLIFVGAMAAGMYLYTGYEKLTSK